MNQATQQESNPTVENSRVPITILSGFLGSGKTTLLNKLLSPSFWEDMQRTPPQTAVIMNEFGGVGLDHQLVEEATGPMALLSGGCICCEIQGSLLPTLKNLWAGRSDGSLPRYERIVIETTGVADPTSIMETLLHSDWVSHRHYLDGVVTTVDAMFVEQQLEEHFEAVRQIATADRLLLTKTDLVEKNSVEDLKSRLKKLNPSAPIVSVTHGDVDPEHVYNLRAYHQSKPEEIKPWLAADSFRAVKPLTPKQHTGIRNPESTASPGVDGRIRSFSLMFDEPLSWYDIHDAMGILTGFCGPRILRMKAIVNAKEYPGRPIVIHAVQHVFYPTVELPAWPDDDHRSRFVFITADLEESVVTNLLKQFTKSVQPNNAVEQS